MSDWASDYARELQSQMNHDYRRHQEEIAKLRAYIKELEQRATKAERLLASFVALIPVGEVVANTKSWEDVFIWFKKRLK